MFDVVPAATVVVAGSMTHNGISPSIGPEGAAVGHTPTTGAG
jgi:hypothetical protein